MNNTWYDSKIRNLVVIVLVVLGVFLAVESLAALANIGIKKSTMMPSNVITVRGEGEAIGVPDVATFSFTVREKAKEVSVAQQTMTDKANKAIDYLKEQDIAEKDIKTIGYYTNPTYEYNQTVCTTFNCPSRQVLTGYEVSETIEVKVRKLDEAGKLLTAIAGLEVGEVSSLSFTIDNPDSLKAEAKKQAIEKARADAKQTARALGEHLGKVVSFYEENPAQPYYGYGGDMMMSSIKAEATNPAPAPLQPGEQKVTSVVSVTFELR